MKKLEELLQKTWFKLALVIIAIAIAYTFGTLGILIGLILLGYSLYLYIKKNTITTSLRKRNMWIAIAGLLLVVVGVSGLSNNSEVESNVSKTSESSSKTTKSSSKSEKEMILSLPDSVEANTSGTADIVGTTLPKAKVRVGQGIIGDTGTADSNGKFTLQYDISKSTKSEVIKITSEQSGNDLTKEITIKQNTQITKKLDEEAAQKAEADKKAKEKAAADKKAADEQAAKEAATPIEYKNALRKAESYSDMMNMSKAGIYDQLTSDAGEGFAPEAAQYAIDNLQADYNKNALEKAKSYQEMMAMSKDAIYDQLTSDAGEKFTPAEAQYAINNLPA